MQVNTKARYLIQELIRENGWLEIPAEGKSMYPVVQEGDICRFVSCETEKLQKGDIVLFQDSSGRLIIQRYVKKDIYCGKQVYRFKSDAAFHPNEPILKKNLIGRLVLIKRKGKVIKASGLLMRCWGKAIIRTPVLSNLLGAYLNKQSPKRTANF